MTEVHYPMKWGSPPVKIKDELVYDSRFYNTDPNVDYMNPENEEVPMIVIESNQISTDTDAPMIIVANEVSEQFICAEEVVETESENMPWESNSQVVYEETVNTLEDVKPMKYERRNSDQFLNDTEENSDIPLNDASYATFHPFPCDFCSRRFKKKANLMNHMVAHQTQRPHSCTICSSRFMRKCDLVNHMKIHSYVPNRENRDDISYNEKYHRSQPYTKNKIKKTSNSPTKKIKQEPRCENMNYFKPTSYVDEDVKLLLEMTSRLHESRRNEELEKSHGMHYQPPPSSQPAVVVEGKPYICNECGKAFAREKALISHSQVHGQDSSYQCSKCGARFFTIDLLRDHTTKKHDTPFTGETSSESSEEEEEEDNERSTYTGDERFGTFQCTGCGISFHRLDLLKRHKKLHCKVDDYPSMYKCHVCNSIFATNEKLTSHLEGSPSCQRHVCLLCGDAHEDPSDLEKHIHSAHSSELTVNTCNQCGKKCKDKRALQKHCNIHSSEKSFSCKKGDCTKRFHSWARLRRHMQSHTNSKAVRCEECEEEFPDRRALINHRHSHFPDSSLRKFVCNECGKSFGSRSSQQIHNRIHTGERPYGCRYCWKAFADGGTLRKHERIHTGEKPYACVICPRAFNQRVVLREHIRSHHSGSVSKPGFSTPVYQCQVCFVVTANSEELAVHLVKHSDENTYKNRNSQPGVRSYKRRKKLNPIEYDEDNEFEDADFFEPRAVKQECEESERGSQSSGVRKSNRINRKIDNYAKFTKTFEAAMKNLNSIIDKPVVKKAKMINTNIPKLPLKKGKRMVMQRGRKRKPIGRPRSTITIDHYDSTNSEEKQTDSDSKSKNKSKKAIRKPAVFQMKEEVDKSEELSCGICSCVFQSKADLLFHVPIHI